MNEHYEAVLADLAELKAQGKELVVHGQELITQAEAGIVAIKQLMRLDSPVVPSYGAPSPPLIPTAEVMPAPRRLKPYYGGGRRAEVPTVLEARVDASYAQFTIAQAIFRFLNVNPRRSFSANEVAAITGKRDQSVRCMLGELCRNDKIIRDAPGRYRAKLEQAETQTR